MAAPGEATAAEMPGASTNTGGSGGYEPDTTASRENVYLLCYSFNQDSSCFVCGTTAGFRVFCLDTYKDDSNTDGTAIRERLRRDPHPHPRSSVMRVAMLMRSSIFAMVNQTFETSGEPAPGCMNKVQIWEERKQKVVAELRCRNEVKSVALHKDIIVMVCEYVIYVYTSGDVKVILHLDTGSNKLGLCAVATGSDPWLLCCPAQNKGAIRIQCGQDATATHVFQAHQSGVACLELSASGSLVATASETGTVMKVFRTKDGEALYRLRRSTRPAVISSLAFGGPDDCYLAVASSSVTVHIFKLDNAMAADVEEKENASPALEPQPDPKWTGPLSAMQTLQSKAADALRGLTPQLLADLRSFGQFHLPDMDGGQPAVDTRSKQSNIAGPILAFHKTRTEPKIDILHYNGFLYEISFEPNFDPKATQECSFLSATTWFATRPDFQVPKPITEFKTEPGVRAVRVRTRQMNGKFYSKPLGSVT